MRFLRARFLLPLAESLGTDTRIEDGYVLWSGDKLLELGAFSEKVGLRLVKEHGATLTVIQPGGDRQGVDSVEQLYRWPGVVLPGFVKTHGHDHEPPIIGLVKDVPLTAWLDGVVNPFTGFMKGEKDSLRELLGRTPQSVSYRKARLDDLYYGITTAMTHHCNFSKYFADDLVESAETAGTRILVAVGAQDRHYAADLLDTPEGAVARLDEYHARHQGKERITILPGPDQFFSNGPEILKALKSWAREHGTLFHCHSSEEKGTTAWFRKTYGQTPVEYAEGLGILDEHTILAHQVHSTEQDLEILARTGTRIVHNPLANTILGSGMPPIVDMAERGIPVAISTDGSGSADSQNILSAARLASQYQKARYSRADYVPAQKALEKITVQAAQMLQVQAGSLEPGWAADLIHIDLDRPNLCPTRRHNLVENLIWATDGSEVDLVIAGGKVVRRGSDFLTLDKAAVLNDVTKLSTAFDEYLVANPATAGTGANQ
jgi:5-methylthioadenosine/S-adenosylhomocysteine deaminase